MKIIIFLVLLLVLLFAGPLFRTLIIGVALWFAATGVKNLLDSAGFSNPFSARNSSNDDLGLA